MCRCSGECCVCACGGCCLAGNGDDDFIPASKEKVIGNLDNNRYERYREYMIKYLKEKFNFEYIKNNESEEKSMLHNVTIKHEENKVLEWVWVMIAMRNSKLTEYNLKTGTTKDLGEESRFMDKKELSHAPTLDEIAQFLDDSGADFVSVVQNYRFTSELPFC